ncbi:MAG: replication restart helicase PriA [Leptospirales bacterium]
MIPVNILPLTGLPQPFLTYNLPENTPEPAPGTRVRIPLGNREVAGLVWNKEIQSPQSGFILKPVSEILDSFPLMPPELFPILSFTSWFYRIPLGLVLRWALPPSTTKPEPLPRRYKNLSESMISKQALLDHLSPTLTDDQSQALNTWRDLSRKGGFSATVLRGVTGSGKTRLYQEMVRDTINQGKQALILTPEIALVPQMEQAFSGIVDGIATIHSQISPSQRLKTWISILNGEKSLVIGPRSSFFAPLKRLGLIIVDEEHDPAYQSYEGLAFNVRNLAIKHSQSLGIPIVLGSATPLAESFYYSQTGRYHSLHLPNRVHGQPLPPILLARQTRSDLFIPPAITNEIAMNLGRGEQTIILLNRRGYAPFLRCISCGFSVSCKRCSVHMVLHKKPNRLLVCHTCGDRSSPPGQCPQCGGNLLAEDGLATQKAEEWLISKFPGSRIERMDQDRTGPKTNALERFQRGEGDILIGTQMIAKGHDFKNVTLGIVLEADRAMSLPDYRGEERAFQLVLQLAGRVGRHKDGGRVYIVTRAPELPFYTFLSRYDWEGFLKKTLKERQGLHYPPFGRMAILTVSDRSESKLIDSLQKASLERLSLPGNPPFNIMGPIPAPIYKARLLYRFQYLIKAPSIETIHAILNVSQQTFAPFKGVRVDWAVDPPDLLSF